MSMTALARSLRARPCSESTALRRAYSQACCSDRPNLFALLLLGHTPTVLATGGWPCLPKYNFMLRSSFAWASGELSACAIGYSWDWARAVAGHEAVQATANRTALLSIFIVFPPSSRWIDRDRKVPRLTND